MLRGKGLKNMSQRALGTDFLLLYLCVFNASVRGLFFGINLSDGKSSFTFPVIENRPYNNKHDNSRDYDIRYRVGPIKCITETILFWYKDDGTSGKN